MAVRVPLPDDLMDAVDRQTTDRVAFVIEAIRRHLREQPPNGDRAELDRLNAHAEELNREAAEVLEFQALR